MAKIDVSLFVKVPPREDEHYTQNIELSLAAIGLLAIIESQRYPFTGIKDLWGYHGAGKDVYQRAYKELEEGKYIARRALRKPDGSFKGYIYAYSEYPMGNRMITLTIDAELERRRGLGDVASLTAISPGAGLPAAGSAASGKSGTLISNSKDQNQKPPIEVSNSYTVPPKKSFAQEVHEVWVAEKHPNWKNHLKLHPDAEKGVRRFLKEIAPLHERHMPDQMDALRDALRAMRADPWWAGKAMGFDNIARKNHLYTFYEKTLQPEQGAESPFKAPPTSGVATSPSHGLSGAPAYLSVDERLSLAWRHVQYRTTGELFEARIAGIDLDYEVTSREFSQDGTARHPVFGYHLKIDSHAKTEAPVKFVEHTQEDVAAYLGQTIEVSVDDVIFNPVIIDPERSESENTRSEDGGD